MAHPVINMEVVYPTLLEFEQQNVTIEWRVSNNGKDPLKKCPLEGVC